MKTRSLSNAVFATLLTVSGSALQAEDFDAKTFLATSCSGCHDTSVYTRKKRMVNSPEQLEAQVRRCDANLGVKLFDDDIQALVTHLNDTYYHFGK